MSQTNLAIAENLYKELGEKNIEAIKKYVHPDVQFSAPLAKAEGKEAYLKAAQGFTTLFDTLTIRAKFAEGDQAMVVYDLECPAPIGLFKSAALLTFDKGLITKVELFYDARPFERG